MGLLHWGIRVHWLIRGKQFLSHTLDNIASEIVLNNVRRAGAIIHTETEAIAIVGRFASVAGVITNADEMIPCQLVLCCTGARPAYGLATQCTEPMLFNNGILVDEQLRTSVRDIYAAGDVAALPNPQTGNYETHGEWYSAVTQGKIAGAMMVGHSATTKELFGAHWHATQLGELSILTVGDPLGISADERTNIYADISGSGYRRIATVDDRLVGYLSVGSTRPDSLSLKRLIDEGFSIRKILKPLLKGNFDAHGYLTKAKARTANHMVARLLPMVEQPQILQQPKTEPSWLQPSIQMPPLERQTEEIRLETQIQQAIRRAATYQPKQSYLNTETDPISRITSSQFAKPESIHTQKQKSEVLDASTP
jgi:NAD(P)H-nitrite reductase large subunit